VDKKTSRDNNQGEVKMVERLGDTIFNYKNYSESRFLHYYHLEETSR